VRALLRLPRFGGANHANDNDNRSRHCQNQFQVHDVDAGGQVGHPSSTEAAVCPGFLSEAVTMPGWHRSLRLVAPLVARASGTGHTVRLMPPAYLKPYVKRQKNDMADAEAICEAVIRTNMRLRNHRPFLRRHVLGARGSRTSVAGKRLRDKSAGADRRLRHCRSKADLPRRRRFFLGRWLPGAAKGGKLAHAIERTTPPSTRSAAPVVADACSEHT
jgi:hypothetical protein